MVVELISYESGEVICCSGIVYIDFLFSFSLVLIFTMFPVGPEEEESKCWWLLKCKINAKCRLKRFERALREK